MLQWRGRLVCPHWRSESGLENKYIAQHYCKKSHNGDRVCEIDLRHYNPSRQGGDKILGLRDTE